MVVIKMLKNLIKKISGCNERELKKLYKKIEYISHIITELGFIISMLLLIFGSIIFIIIYVVLKFVLKVI